MKIDKTTTYNVDCMEYMDTLPDKYFELAIVDPPYGIDATKFNLRTNQHKKNGHKMWDTVRPTLPYFDELFRISQYCIVWGGNYFADLLIPNNEWIVWYKNNDGVSFSMAEMAWTNTGVNTKVFDYRPIGRLDKIHPTQKPVALYKWLLQKYAKQGDKILDTHLGSGSSRIAVYNLGFEFVGCELDNEYFDLQEKRFLDHKSQLQMF